jgi:hypothetical protein
MGDLSLFEAIHWARAMRRSSLLVPEALLTRILDAAVRALSTGNSWCKYLSSYPEPDLGLSWAWEP